MAFFCIFSHFSPFLAINEWFWGRCWSLESSIFQSAIEIWRFWLKWGVNQLLGTWRCHYMAFFCIFSHFSPILAKNGWFWGRCWGLESSIFQSAMKIYRFWLKWGIYQLQMMCQCWDMTFSEISRFAKWPFQPEISTPGAYGYLWPKWPIFWLECLRID